MKSSGARFASRSAGQFARGLGLREQSRQALAVGGDHFAHFGANRGRAGVLELMEHHAGDPGVRGNESHVPEERLFDGRDRRRGGGCGVVEHLFEGASHPRKHREPDRFLVRKMAEEGALRDADTVRDGLGGDGVRTLFAGQGEDGGDDLALPVDAGEAMARRTCGRRQGRSWESDK